jgi:hypothetical protein
MHRSLIPLLFILATLAGPLPRAAAERGEASVARLSWLAGCWEGEQGGRRYEEQWMAPRGGSMIGMSRTVRGDRTSEFEFMHIREEEGRLVFTARPSGQEEASFRSVEIAATKVVFENPAHDFPQRIIYLLEGDGSLTARIEGEQDGRSRGLDFPMRRTECPGGWTRRRSGVRQSPRQGPRVRRT